MLLQIEKNEIKELPPWEDNYKNHDIFFMLK